MKKFPSLSKVNDFATRKDWETKAWEDFIVWCASCDSATLKIIMESIMSTHERGLITRRAAAIEKIIVGTPYREIGRELWLTNQTISSIKKGLKTQSYTSNWVKAKSQKIAKRIDRLQKLSNRPTPKQYRRTKYGKIRML